MATAAFRSLSLQQKLVMGAMAAVGGSIAVGSLANNGGNPIPPNWNFNGAKKALLGFGAAKQFDQEALVNTREAAQDIKPQDYYQKIYNEIAEKLIEEDDHDDGSFGPILVRLAWHNCGSYDQNDKTKRKGGSYSGTMRFEKEQEDPENAGLPLAMKFVDSLRDKYPEISHGDLYTLAGVVGIQEMAGPKIAWRPGRKDLGLDNTPPYHRLPAASEETGEYLRTVFQHRLGFTDKELVVLIGVGHAIGRCHTFNSGYDGPWTFSPTTVSNEYFKLLLNENWTIRDWDGKRQYEDSSKSLMMLPADMALKHDDKLRAYVEEYAKDQDKCFSDFSKAFSKLLERGINFGNTKPMYFKTLEEQQAN